MSKGTITARKGAVLSSRERGRIGMGLQLVIWVAVFSVAYLLRDVAGVGFPDILLTGICGLAFLFLDVGSAMGMYFFTTALTVPHNEIRIVYIVLTAMKLMRSGGVKLNAGLLCATLGCMLVQLVNVALFSTQGLVELIYDYVTRMLVFLLPVLWYSRNASPRSYRQAVLCYLWGVMLGGTITLILTVRTYGFMTLLTGTRYIRLGKTVAEVAGSMQTTYNANQLAGMLAVAIAILLTYMDKGYLPKLPSVAVIVYALMLLLMTRSRTGLLTTIGAFVLYYWVAVIRKGRIRQGLIIFAGMVAVIAVVVNLIPGVVTAASNRFINQEDITNGRSDLLVGYMKEWLGSPWCFLFGYGIGSYEGMVDPNIGFVPHNSIMDILICWGLLGLVLLVICLVLMYRRNRWAVSRQDVLLAYLPAIVAIVASMAAQYTTAGWPHMRLCLLLLAARAFQEPADGGRRPVEVAG